MKSRFPSRQPSFLSLEHFYSGLSIQNIFSQNGKMMLPERMHITLLHTLFTLSNPAILLSRKRYKVPIVYKHYRPVVLHAFVAITILNSKHKHS